MLKRKEHQALLNFSLAALGYIPPQTEEELQAFEELHKTTYQESKTGTLMWTR